MRGKEIERKKNRRILKKDEVRQKEREQKRDKEKEK